MRACRPRKREFFAYSLTTRSERFVPLGCGPSSATARPFGLIGFIVMESPTLVPTQPFRGFYAGKDCLDCLTVSRGCFPAISRLTKSD